MLNKLAFGKYTDLEDDVETKLLDTGVYNLQDFVEGTVEYINSGIPFIIQKLKELD
jgi:hypothetical protein